jgi:Ca2+-binding RTX toxin-like protein
MRTSSPATAVTTVLEGYAGNDTLNGGLGNDTLSWWRRAATSIRFDTLLNALSNRDTISDFDVAADSIELENAHLHVAEQHRHPGRRVVPFGRRRQCR